MFFYEEPFAGALGKKVSKLGPLLAIVGVAHVPAGDLFSSSNISSGLHDDAEHPISDATVPYLLGADFAASAEFPGVEKAEVVHRDRLGRAFPWNLVWDEEPPVHHFSGSWKG